MAVSFDAFTTSRDTLEERIKICSLLADLDPENGSAYAEELKNITTQLTIQDGLRDVDRSRVHVDTEAVTRWAERHLTEDFLRYRDLLKAHIGFGSLEEFQTAMRRLGEGDRSSVEQFLHYPEQEGDDLLIDTFEEIKREYLLNPDYGLDAYLSMRIRHGSLAGHLRGPLEERDFIVTKDDNDSNYRENTALTNRLHPPPWELPGIFNAFREFSKRYDEIIEDLTKNRLQIRRAEKPLGMFSLPLELNPLSIHYVRSHIHETTTFSEFLDLAFGGIEILLHQCLIAVRDYIVTTVKQQVESAFETLRVSLSIDTSVSTYGRLNSEIADAIPEVQAAIGRIAEWFEPVEKQQVKLRTFEDVVEIGIAVTRLAHRGFSPKIEKDIEVIGVRSAVALSEFNDIFFTILDNVHAHSGNKVSPWVKLRVWTEPFDTGKRVLRIRVESEVAEGAYSDTAADKLSRIRRQMESGEYRKHVNLEGGTGLLKLKRYTSLDELQKVTVDFIGHNVFFVELRLLFKFVRVAQTDYISHGPYEGTNS